MAGQFDRHKLIIINYRGNEQWNVAVMGFKNSFAYMQKQIDGLLKPFKFVKIYVDYVGIKRDRVPREKRQKKLENKTSNPFYF